MPDDWGFCEGWRGGLIRAQESGKGKEFEKHMASCVGCQNAQKKWDRFWKEIKKCGDGF